MTEAFDGWFDSNFLDPDGGASHLPDWFRGDMQKAWDAGRAAQAAPEPSVWILKYRTKNTPENVSAYLNEKDAQRAASNVRMYAHASEVAVVPAYSMPSAHREAGK